MQYNTSTNNHEVIGLSILLSNFYEIGFTFFLIFSLVLNLYFCLIYKTCVFWTAFTFGPLHKNPVNALIVIDETIKMIALFGQSLIVYASITGYTLPQLYGDFCQFLMFSSASGQSLSFVGGTCIAFFRLLYIKHQEFFRIFGELKTALMLMALQLAYMFGICYGKTRKFQEFEMFWRTCFPFVEVDPIIARRNQAMVVGSLFVLTILEAVIYAIIFSFLIRHNRDMARTMPENIIKKRKRKNVLDLVEHFAHFLGEIGQVICWSLASLTFKKVFSHFSLYIYFYQNGILAVIMIAINSTLRSLAVQWFLNTYTSLIFQFLIILIITTSILLVVMIS